MHRDLKPANIGVTHDNKVVLLDMGCVIQCTSECEIQPTPGCGGTIGYLAPERELSCYGHKADIWSLGIILFEMTFRSHPWPGRVNPWRSGREELQKKFMVAHEQTMRRLKQESREDLRDGV